MTYRHKPDSGSLFRNDRREKDTHPHAQGTALIDGVEYYISAWTNTNDSGEKWQGLKFKRKEEKRDDRARRDERRTYPPDDYDDDFPF